MSRQYNPAISAYNRINLDDLAELEARQKTNQTGSGLLVRSSMGEQLGSNIAKNHLIITAMLTETTKRF